MGSTPLRIGHASIALRSSGAAINAASLRELRFGGVAAITMPAGAPALSDPVALPVPNQADLAVSLYLPGSAQATTLHNAALQTSYVSPAGDYTSTAWIPGNYLNEGLYTVEVAVASLGKAGLHKLVHHAAMRDAVSFHVYDPGEGDSSRGRYSGHLRGPVRPLLEWTTDRRS